MSRYKNAHRVWIQVDFYAIDNDEARGLVSAARDKVLDTLTTYSTDFNYPLLSGFAMFYNRGERRLDGRGAIWTRITDVTAFPEMENPALGENQP